MCTKLSSRGVFCAALVAATAGVLGASVFCFVVYPRIEKTYHAVLDPDGFGILGEQLWKTGSLSYAPEEGPTINRGPFYPFLIALVYATNGRANPQLVQMFQSFLFGITCALTVWLCWKLKITRGALIAGILVSVHPFLIWYTSRIWVESVAMFFFTAICVSSLSALEQPSVGRAIGLGILIGLAALAKGVFLLFAFFAPLLLALWPRHRLAFHQAVVIFIGAVLVVAPWTYRNYRLTGLFIPVHVNAGYATALGNTFIDNFPDTGFRLGALHEAGNGYIRRHVYSMPKEAPRWQADLLKESSCRTLARQWRSRSPFFPVRKIALNAVFFWVLSETPLKSFFVASLQLPLVVFWLIGIGKAYRENGLSDERLIPSVFIFIYYLAHLPIIACARYSAIVVPAMAATIIATWFPPRSFSAVAPLTSMAGAQGP